jgi:hypothetical protein
MAQVLPNDLVVHPVSRKVPVELAALCDVAELGLRAVEARGLLGDDRPDLALATLRRWCEGRCTVEELDAAAAEATEAVSLGFATPAALAYGAVDWLCLAAQDERPVLDDEVREWVLRNVRDALVALGEPREAAAARASGAYRAALRRRRR